MTDEQPRPERVWLLHGIGPEGGDAWSDDPNPENIPNDEVVATEYVRADVAEVK